MTDLTNALNNIDNGSDTDFINSYPIIVEAAREWADHQGTCPLLVTVVEDPDHE